jgi:YgiT-type zinc finger domain-containing protein
MNLSRIDGLILSNGGIDMRSKMPEENFVEQTVTYTLEVKGRFIIVEHVPARVCLETGERFFSPATVERLQKIVWEQQVPNRVIETPVFEFPGTAA